MIELREAAFVAPGPAGDVRVLAPTSLALREHRIALIGPNGSGKSTLARMLNGLVLPSSGSVTVRGHDTARQGADVRRLVGFAFTNPAAQLVMPTAVEDVSLSLRRAHPKKADRLAAARVALDRFGLGELAERSVHTLSGGQQQLLALAGVLAADPEILVADEPTTLLDLRNSRLVAETLFALEQQLIVATHDLELAARCDRVLVIQRGAVAYDSADTTIPDASPAAA
ncbi:MAG: ABC transporter ATP-binding protein, partial [Actinobacteria bacterium]|nr:ABC transporter ATP-binding protein [Actinomycetota bacterium]